ncbi:MAG: M4 family metallopeptidase [Proteobacteria bacterium]|nr:M4 family metallopeptidase [Pseudomonadota bacterium]
MQTIKKISSLALSFSLTMPLAVLAADVEPLEKKSLNDLKKDFDIIVPGKPLLKMSANTLNYIKENTDLNQITHIRMRQQYYGFEVYGGYAILHTKSKTKNLYKTDEKVSMNGEVYKELEKELGAPTSDYVKKGMDALAYFKDKYENLDLSEEKVEPIVYIDDDKKAHWAYRISFHVRYDDKIPERPTAIIDANNNHIYAQWNDIKTLVKKAVYGMGYGGNAKMGEYQFGKTHPLLSMTRDYATDTCYMENPSVKIVDMKREYSSSNNPMSFKCIYDESLPALTFWTGYQADGYDKNNGAFSPSNDALYAGSIVKTFYKEWYGSEVLRLSNKKPMKLVMRVHYGKGYDNAYWDGRQMTFGDGNDKELYPLVSLGISAHEISHGFTEQNSDLEYHFQSGGINESFSDMASQVAEYYVTGTNTWQIGSEILKKDEALRYMDKPSRDGRSIDSASQYKKSMNVHYSSGVYNRLFYLMSNNAGWDVKKAFEVMLKANMDYWRPTSNFAEAACGVLNATKDLGYSLEDVKSSLDKVAIKYSQCVL